MKTVVFNDVYVKSSATAVGPMEKKGPLGKYFDVCYDDNYCGEDTFEKAERHLIKDACDFALRKANLKVNDIDLFIGGDLINQLTSSHYFAKDVDVSFIGMYGACSNSSLTIAQGSLWVDTHFQNVMCFTSSHNATAERQFRYPNEYGIQKKVTTTYTVTGAGAVVLSKDKSNIRISSCTIGKIIDWNHMDANDMGKAMAPAAFETINEHLKNRNQCISDYDMIATGDLSKIGFSMLCDFFKENNVDIDNRLHDCGLMIYDLINQDVFAGGSGCGCSMCVTLSKLFDKLQTGQFRRILVVATGALLSPVATQQKESIPCIAHAVEYEWSDVE